MFTRGKAFYSAPKHTDDVIKLMGFRCSHMLLNVLCLSSLLQLQWKQDLDLGLELISKAIEIDNKCDFAYETMGTIEVQR